MKMYQSNVKNQWWRSREAEGEECLPLGLWRSFWTGHSHILSRSHSLKLTLAIGTWLLLGPAAAEEAPSPPPLSTTVHRRTFGTHHSLSTLVAPFLISLFNLAWPIRAIISLAHPGPFRRPDRRSGFCSDALTVHFSEKWRLSEGRQADRPVGQAASAAITTAALWLILARSEIGSRLSDAH